MKTDPTGVEESAADFEVGQIWKNPNGTAYRIGRVTDHQVWLHCTTDGTEGCCDQRNMRKHFTLEHAPEPAQGEPAPIDYLGGESRREFEYDRCSYNPPVTPSQPKLAQGGLAPLASMKHEDLCHFVFRMQCENEELRGKLAAELHTSQGLREGVAAYKEQERLLLERVGLLTGDANRACDLGLELGRRNAEAEATFETIRARHAEIIEKAQHIQIADGEAKMGIDQFVDWVIEMLSEGRPKICTGATEGGYEYQAIEGGEVPEILDCADYTAPRYRTPESKLLKDRKTK